MWVFKDSTSKQTQRQTGGRGGGSQVGVGSAPSGGLTITHFHLTFFSLHKWTLNYFNFYCERYDIP